MRFLALRVFSSQIKTRKWRTPLSGPLATFRSDASENLGVATSMRTMAQRTSVFPTINENAVTIGNNDRILID
jgi:hypothetical protein